MPAPSPLGSLDFDKLFMLAVLLEERSVSGAARKLDKAQPTLSHALGQLREIFSDPLLVRSGNTMVLTERAEALRVPLQEALNSLHRLTSATTFEPHSAEAHFHLACTDFMAGLLLPSVSTRLRREAPNIRLSLENWNGRRSEHLAQPDLDLGIGSRATTEGGIYQRRLFDESFVCVAAKTNRRVHRNLKAEAFARLPHMQLSVKGLGSGAVDRALLELGLRRHIALSVAHFWLAADFLEGSDLVLTAPRRLFERWREEGRALKSVKVPVSVQGFSVTLLWHERSHHDPAHRWLRSCIVDAAAGARSHKNSQSNRRRHLATRSRRASLATSPKSQSETTGPDSSRKSSSSR